MIVIRPISYFDYSMLTEFSSAFAQEAETAAIQGENMARKAAADIIKAESEAYILDKAAAMNASVTVQIILDSDSIPVQATLSGRVSPYVRRTLASVLESDLGITKENQLWTG